MKSARILKWKINAKLTKAHYLQISFQSRWLSAIDIPVITVSPRGHTICLCHCLCLVLKVFHHEYNTYSKTINNTRTFLITVSTQNDPRKILTKNKNPSMGALGYVLDWKQIKNCYSKVSHWIGYIKTIKTTKTSYLV